jgi:hypothetical protein
LQIGNTSILNLLSTPRLSSWKEQQKKSPK